MHNKHLHLCVILTLSISCLLPNSGICNDAVKPLLNGDLNHIRLSSISLEEKIAELISILDERIEISKSEDTSHLSHYNPGNEYSTILYTIATLEINNSSELINKIDAALKNVDQNTQLKNKEQIKSFLHIVLGYVGGKPDKEMILKVLFSPATAHEITLMILRTFDKLEVPIKAIPKLVDLLRDSWFYVDQGSDIGSYKPKGIFPLREWACKCLAKSGIKCEVTYKSQKVVDPTTNMTRTMPTTEIVLDRNSLVQQLKKWIINDNPNTWRPAIEVAISLNDNDDVKNMMSDLLAGKNLDEAKSQFLRKR